MSVIFFWKCSKFNADSKNAQKNPEKIFCFWDKCIWIICIQLSVLIREYLSSAVNVLKKRLKNFTSLRVTFATPLPSQWSLKMRKALWLILNQCFGPLTMLPVKGFSQTGPFRHLSKHFFGWLVISEIHKLWAASSFQNVWNLIQIRKMHKKIEEKCSVFEINASELFAFNCLY